MHKNQVYLLTGSNQEEPQLQLHQAIIQIEGLVGKITSVSSIYLTAAWGNTDQPDFLNQIMLVETKYSAREVLNIILEIEKDMGRIRTVKNAPRIIDIDILFYNDDIIQKRELTIPHPSMHLRKFVLQPLHEIAPDLIHPVFNKSITDLLHDCPDTLDVNRI